MIYLHLTGCSFFCKNKFACVILDYKSLLPTSSLNSVGLLIGSGQVFLNNILIGLNGVGEYLLCYVVLYLDL